ncbi:MAG: GC-type dockerin domain-anchored protein [Planctomycetota bacterium]|nr:GC-type dockerin domain-anchored protein [Planctomycetota bacterium]
MMRFTIACAAVSLGVVALAGSAIADVMTITTESGTLLRYDVNASGTPAFLSSTTKPGLLRPFGLATRLNGDLVVGDRGPCTACAGGGMMNINAPTCGSIGDVRGTLTTNFFNPHDLIVLGDHVYMVNEYANAIRRAKFNADGTFSDIGNDPIINTDGRGIVVHPQLRELFVSMCCGSNRIRRFTINADGTLTFRSDITGNAISNPHGMCVSPSGELFVANYDGNSVSRFTFDAAGNAIANGTITGNAQNRTVSVAIAPWGELFVGGNGDGTVSRFTFGAGGAAVANGSFNVGANIDKLIFAAEPPVVLSGPAARQACPLTEISLSMINAAGAGIGDYTYAWQAYVESTGTWRTLQNGPGEPPFVAVVSGATTPTLTLSDINYSDATLYRVIVTGNCGVAVGQPTRLAMCRADYNCDGFLSFADFDDFVSAFEAGEAQSDFNGDGFLTFEDFDAFVEAFVAGC